MARDLIKSDLTIKSIKPGDSRKRLGDGDGLYLLLFVKGGAHGWRFDYTFQSARKTISLGTYPDTGLKLAREKAEKARKLVAGGVDPSEDRKEQNRGHVAKKAAKIRHAAGEPDTDSFEGVFRDFVATKKSGWSATYLEKLQARIVNDVLPWLGSLPIKSIDEKMLIACVRRVQERGAIESAHSTLQNCGQVFKFGIADGRASRNPAQGMAVALAPIITKHMAALIDPQRFGDLMRGIADYKGTALTKTALILASITFQRPVNIRSMEWAHLELDGAHPLWTIPSEKMKRTVQQKISGRPHLVPLAPQAVNVLRELQPISGHGRYVFPSLLTGERCMSENTVNTALRRMGFTKEEMTGHGFRASAKTILQDKLGADMEVIEAQLAHKKSGPLGAAYDRAEYMAQRRSLMILWADYVDAMRDGKTIEQFQGTVAA
jgi:integrase